MQYGILLVMIIGMMLSGNLAYGAQLEAKIFNDSSEMKPSFKFLRVIYLENTQGGEFAGLFSDSKVKFSANSSTSDLSGLILQINESIKESDSNVIVTDVALNYQAIITEQKKSIAIEYNVEIIPTIRNHIDIDGTSILVDSRWRGFQIDDPIIVETEQYGTFDVNNPSSVLQATLPQAYSVLKDVDVLNISLVDASGILELPISKWHYLFDPTALQKSSDDYGYKGVLTSEYSLGECTIAIGVCDDKKWIGTVSLDKEYTIRAVESRDDAVISIEGYTTIHPESEIIAVTSKRPDIADTKGGFQTSVIYGMAGISAVSTGVFFFYSNRKIKNDRNAGQTGIDPARLRVQETSHSAGGYKTNRGEAYLDSELPDLPFKTSKTPV